MMVAWRRAAGAIAASSLTVAATLASPIAAPPEGPAPLFGAEADARRRGDTARMMELHAELGARFPQSHEAQVSRMMVARLLLDRALLLAGPGGTPPPLESAMAKLACNVAAKHVCDEAIQLLVQAAHADKEDAAESYDLLRRTGYFEPSSKVSRAKLQNVIDQERKAGIVGPSLTVDKLVIPGFTELSD